MRKRRIKHVMKHFITREYIENKYNPKPKPDKFCKVCNIKIENKNKTFCTQKCKSKYYYNLYQKPKQEAEKHRNTYLRTLSDDDFYNEVCIPLRDNLRVKE
jgi:predicted nucleic acid-binding Zn ribbon protein